jgi:hypothetical protein
MPRWLIWSVVALIVAVAGVWGGVAWYRQATYGPRYAEQQQDVKASVGDVFSLVVRDRGGSVGDNWTASVADGAVASQVRSELIADSVADRLFGAAPGGGAGNRLITFRAKASGTTRITLANCYRGCATEDDKRESRSVSWTVTVER